LADVARVERARAPARQLSSSDGNHAVLLSITKKSQVNTLDLVERLSDYVQAQNTLLAPLGLSLLVSDDQTVPTREAISVMQRNALLGMLLVLAVCWVFLGARISLVVSLGIPFSLMGSFAVLGALGFTVNVSVLLGVVIALGMIVDDAVVVVESIYYRMSRGMRAFQASQEAIREVWRPVLASVVTTMAAFLPLMLMPGIVGKFMFVIPFVVTLALLISLVEAFWIAPVHVASFASPAAKLGQTKPDWRTRFNRAIRLRYGQMLVAVLRRPKASIASAVACLLVAVGLVNTEVIRVQFFAFDPIRLFYVNVDMPADATLEETLAETEAVEQVVRRHLNGVGPGLEARAVSSTVGMKFTETDRVLGDQYGQVTVSLQPRSDASRDVQGLVDRLRPVVEPLEGRRVLAGHEHHRHLAVMDLGGGAHDHVIAVHHADAGHALASAIACALRDISSALSLASSHLFGPSICISARLNRRKFCSLSICSASTAPDRMSATVCMASRRT
jgi:multidrug efflux pump subunit AcrB